MSASAARIAANRLNAQKSTGPKTPEGKEASRANALKHGLTGAGVVLPEREAAEVARRSEAFFEEIQPAGEMGMTLIRIAAIMATRVERCVSHETAVLTARVRRAEAEFVPPEGCDEATAAKLRTEAGKLALFDPSPEATLARKYEAAALRGYFRALKELRQHERAMKAADDEAEAELAGEVLASFRQADLTDDEFDRMCALDGEPAPRMPEARANLADLLAARGRVDVPIAVGKRR